MKYVTLAIDHHARGNLLWDAARQASVKEFERLGADATMLTMHEITFAGRMPVPSSARSEMRTEFCSS